MVNFFHCYEDNSSLSASRTATALIGLVSDMLLVMGSTLVDSTILSLIYQARNREYLVHVILVEI